MNKAEKINEVLNEIKVKQKGGTLIRSLETGKEIFIINELEKDDHVLLLECPNDQSMDDIKLFIEKIKSGDPL